MEKKPQQSESRSADKYIVRFPEGMRDRITELAKANNRSMNAEIVQRLEWALSTSATAAQEVRVQEIRGELPVEIALNISLLAEDNNVPFEEMVARVYAAGIHKDAPEVLYLAIHPGATAEDLRTALEVSSKVVRSDATIVSEMHLLKKLTPPN